MRYSIRQQVFEGAGRGVFGEAFHKTGGYSLTLASFGGLLEGASIGVVFLNVGEAVLYRVDLLYNSASAFEQLVENFGARLALSWRP